MFMRRIGQKILGLIIALSYLIALSGIVYGQDASTNVSVITKSSSYNASNFEANKSASSSNARTELMNPVSDQKMANGIENCSSCSRNLYKSVTIAVIERNANNSALNETLNDTSTKSEAITKLNATLKQNEKVTCYSIKNLNYIEANTSSSSNLTDNKTALAKGSCLNCSKALNASLPINEPPCCSIIAPSSVCADSNGNVASVLYQERATYEWEITNGVITSAANLPQITWTAGSYPTSVSLKVKVTKTNGTGASTSVCVCENNITIPVFQNLGCVINVPTLSVCEGSSNKASVPFQVGVTYIWEVTNGSITSGQGTNQIDWYANRLSSVLPSTATIKATVDRAPGDTFNVCTCSKSITIHVNPDPNCAITAPASVCKGSKNNKASVPDAGLGAIYEWEISNGSITAGQGTREITWDAGLGPIPIVIKVKVANAYGCACSAGI
jgi:hypothetical protein